MRQQIDVVYDGVCAELAELDHAGSGYDAAGTAKDDLPPTMRDVTLHNVRVSGGGRRDSTIAERRVKETWRRVRRCLCRFRWSNAHR